MAVSGKSDRGRPTGVRDGVGQSDVFQYQGNPLKIHVVFAHSRDFA
jgi:hypothetical protein